MTISNTKPQKPKKLHPKALPHIAEILKALGHPIRLRLLECLAPGEASVGVLQERLQTPQAIVSQQLRILRSSGVVTFRRQGTLSLYSLAIPGLLNLLSCLQNCQEHCLSRLGITPTDTDHSTEGA